MKISTKKSAVILALTASFVIGNTSAVFAASTPNPNRVAYDAQIALHKVAMEKHRADMKSFHGSMKVEMNLVRQLMQLSKQQLIRLWPNTKPRLPLQLLLKARVQHLQQENCCRCRKCSS